MALKIIMIFDNYYLLNEEYEVIEELKEDQS